MSMLRKLGLLVLLAGAFSAGNAQVLDMQGAAGAQVGSRPERGMTAARVEQRFGAPDRKVAAVGDPPISRWVYRDFVVYFEYDRVIHAVVKR